MRFRYSLVGETKIPYILDDFIWDDIFGSSSQFDSIINSLVNRKHSSEIRNWNETTQAKMDFVLYNMQRAMAHVRSSEHCWMSNTIKNKLVNLQEMCGNEADASTSTQQYTYRSIQIRITYIFIDSSNILNDDNNRFGPTISAEMRRHRTAVSVRKSK